MGELDAARREYEETLKYNPKFTPARVLLGVTLFSQGKNADAERAWEEALAQDPDNKSAGMYLRMVRGNALKTTPPTRPNIGEMDSFSLAESSPYIEAPPPDKLDDDDEGGGSK
jgi:tetratricopeptide (TPR) repeat protein